MLYAEVQRNKANGQKFVNIKRNSQIKEGDWVLIKLVPDEVMDNVE